MKKYFFILMLGLILSVSASAHTAFTLVSSKARAVKKADIAALEKAQTMGVREGNTLTFKDGDISLVATTGPEDDMLSYRIQGIRNPNLVLPGDATIKVLFINTDVDMRHDIRFGHKMGDFPIDPSIAETAGTKKLVATAEDGTMQAEEIVIQSNEDGAYKYFCSVRGHAKGGMWGNILIGVKPGPELKVAPKTEHKHSADEDHAPAKGVSMPAPSPSPHMHPGMPAAKPAATPEQHQHGTPAAKPTPTPHAHGEETAKTSGNMAGMDHSKMDMGGKKDADHAGMPGMSMRSSVNIGEPMSREGSGTSWVPDTSPAYGYMKMFDNGGMLMLHGVGFLRYKSVGSTRDISASGDGDRARFDAPTMFMTMYSKPINERSQFGLRGMFSLDPIIERGYGYPLLYQSGELHKGEPLHDRQHPHDFISELAATYSYKLSDRNSFYLYAGLPGEPALGPPMYLHRASGMNMPDAPIGHHWQDASHITFGVVTAGFTHDKFKIEASAFNGTEPDERRFAFDKPRLNSFSGRLSFNPNKNWSLQVSHGYLRNPERAEPEIRILRRTTASAIYNKRFSEDRNWASTFVWGQNHTHEGSSNAFLYETNYDFGKNAVFGRLEKVQKNAHELVLEGPHPEGNLWVGAYSFGYLRDIVKDKGIDVGIGGMATINTNPASISSFYGGTTHGGWSLFMRFRPSRSH